MNTQSILKAIESGCGDIEALCAAVANEDRSAVRAQVMAKAEAIIADGRLVTRDHARREVCHGRYNAAMDIAAEAPEVGMRDRLQRASWLLGRGGK